MSLLNWQTIPFFLKGREKLKTLYGEEGRRGEFSKIILY
jgi:hypothetical protein